ncbi:hypothetical protein BKA70DRAFT_1127028 [Coprinopsis sp. MPI-PUGE-AT-0042]|nr:hypothetical protein BKA70DRAFT_1127028 [Coprinopsis sp. MPI-PUGE-AT-0042]
MHCRNWEVSDIFKCGASDVFRECHRAQGLTCVNSQPSKKSKTLRALPTFSGCGKTSIYNKQKELEEGSRGCSSITSFFQPKQARHTSESEAENEVEEISKAQFLSPVVVTPKSMDEFWQWIDNRTQTVTVPLPEALPSAPVPSGTSVSEAEAPISPPEPSLHVDTGYSAWLDVDEEFLDEVEGECVDLMAVIKALIRGAKKHKSFASTFKLEAVKAYLDLLEKYKRNPKVKNPRTRASLSVASLAGRGQYFARQLRHLASYIGRFHTLPPTNSGKHHAHPSLLNDERVAQAVRRYLTVVAAGEIGPEMLMRQVNTVIIPALGLDLGGHKIGVRCARRWLRKLGYSMTEVKKGVYVDGHERPDVVAYRERFLEEILANERLRYQFDEKTLEPIAPVLKDGEKLHIPVFQDETIIRSNDLRRRVWAKDGRLPIRKKGQGHSIHVSDFIVEYTGRLQLSPEQQKEQESVPADARLPNEARVIIFPGKNADGWWNATRLIKQSMPLFEKLYPGAVAEFFFDQSTAHGAYAPDALNAAEMNVNPGGKQRRMHDTVIPESHPNPALRGKVQTMVYGDDEEDETLRGQPKGMRKFLQDRELWEALCEANGGKPIPGDCANCKMTQKERERRAREEAEAMAGLDEPDGDDDDGTALIPAPDPNRGCCMRKVISQQPDFLEEKPLLQIIIEARGHKCYFLPKFHCELNPIEMYWGWLKIRYRALADGSWATAKRLVPELLDECSTKTIRAFFRKAWRYMDAYGRYLNAKQAEFAVKKYSSHRRVGARIMMNFAMLDNPV